MPFFKSKKNLKLTIYCILHFCDENYINANRESNPKHLPILQDASASQNVGYSDQDIAENVYQVPQIVDFVMDYSSKSDQEKIVSEPENDEIEEFTTKSFTTTTTPSTTTTTTTITTKPPTTSTQNPSTTIIWPFTEESPQNHTLLPDHLLENLVKNFHENGSTENIDQLLEQSSGFEAIQNLDDNIEDFQSMVIEDFSEGGAWNPISESVTTIEPDLHIYGLDDDGSDMYSLERKNDNVDNQDDEGSTSDKIDDGNEKIQQIDAPIDTVDMMQFVTVAPETRSTRETKDPLDYLDSQTMIFKPNSATSDETMNKESKKRRKKPFKNPYANIPRESLFNDGVQNYDFYLDHLYFSPYDPKVDTQKGLYFNKVVYWSDKPWLILFYADYCPYSIAYIARFKQLVKYLNNPKHPWKNVLRIGVINCNNPHDKMACRQQHVNAYPTLKFYRPKLDHRKSNPDRLGHHYKGSRRTSHVTSFLFDFLTETSENQVYSRKSKKVAKWGWRSNKLWRYDQPAPMLDQRKSENLVNKVVNNRYNRRATKIVVVLNHWSINHCKLVILNMSGYRGVTIFYRIFDRNETESSDSKTEIQSTEQQEQPHVDIYPYCDEKQTIPFESAISVTKKLMTLVDAHLGIDVKDEDVGTFLYPIENEKNCEMYKFWVQAGRAVELEREEDKKNNVFW